MIRIFFSCCFSLVVVFALFLLMQRVIFQDGIHKVSKISYNFVDFIKLKPKKEQQKERERKRIEKKEKILPKRLHVSHNQKITRQNIKVQMPRLDLPLDFKKTNDLNGISVAQELKPKQSTLEYATDIIPIFTIPPEYPRMAKRRNIQGFVVLHFTIDKKGGVTNITIEQSKPKGYFEEAAKKAISKWKFNPKIENGEPIEQLAQQRLEFKLR